LLADIRASRAYLAAELSRPGWLDFGAFRWRDLAAGKAVRATFGVVTPLAIGLATGHEEFGSFAALGALPAGFVSFRGVTRTRILSVTLAAAGMAVSTFIGAVAEATHPLLLVPVIFVWAYAAGLLAALGPTALVVSLQWPVALLIASALPLHPAEAAGRALLVLAGGLWQALLVVISWAVTRGSAERTALAQSFSALAQYAADLAAGSQELAPEAAGAGRRAMRDPNPLLRSASREHMLDLNEEAERIRASLTALGAGGPDDRSYVPGGTTPPDPPSPDPPSPHPPSPDPLSPGPGARRLLASAQLVLGEIAAALLARPGQRSVPLLAARSELAAAEAALATRWSWAGEALLGQLRSACRITNRLNEAEPARSQRDWAAVVGPEVTPVRDAALTLRASIGMSSEAGRHALRLAVTTAVAEVIVRAAALPHDYWGVLTIFIVLRPDYSSTLYRGLQRAGGTVVGAGLGILTVQLGRLGITALLIGIAVSLLAAYAVIAVNYLLYAVFLTDFVVVLLDLLGLPPVPTALARLTGTGIGTGLALLAYVFWPTWGGSSAGDKLARMLELEGQYAAALLHAYTRPSRAERDDLTRLRLATRRARIDAEAATDRLAGEPDRPPLTAGLARSLMSAGHSIAQSVSTLTAVVTAHHSAPADQRDAELQAQLDHLADDLGDATAVLAQALRERTAPPAGRARVPPLPPLPQLRELQQEVWLAAAAAEPDGGGHPAQAGRDGGGPAAAEPERSAGAAAGLFAATDGLADAVNTVADLLRG
jgi:uncharacterized membrane protein YccC